MDKIKEVLWSTKCKTNCRFVLMQNFLHLLKQIKDRQVSKSQTPHIQTTVDDRLTAIQYLPDRISKNGILTRDNTVV